jgi:hypothetical protein
MYEISRYLNAERYPAHSSNVKRIILKIKPEKISYVPGSGGAPIPNSGRRIYS